uniref:MADF domain-containing protein n=1 Tax=Romanomermis culicivorax TaxID=13658 RepID=A0A915JT98_ROMCU
LNDEKFFDAGGIHLNKIGANTYSSILATAIAEFKDTKEALIDSVRNHSLVYDPGNRDYFKQNVMDQCWTVIADELKQFGLSDLGIASQKLTNKKQNQAMVKIAMMIYKISKQ